MRVFSILGLAAFLLATSSCEHKPESFVVWGRLAGEDFGCVTLTDGGRTYELAKWQEPRPLIGSLVVLRIRLLQDYASSCMRGPIAEVLDVLRETHDFRTAPVTGDEVWGPSDTLVIGDIVVERGASLTLLPGASVTITEFGQLRVRGRLDAVGTEADSVRIHGGPVVLDSIDAASRISHTAFSHLSIRGDAPDIVHVSGRLTVAQGSAVVRNSRLDAASADGGHITLEASTVGAISGVHGDFTVASCTVGRLDLSYSRADVFDSRFTGPLTYVIYHGASGGSLENNRFESAQTIIEVRHTSNPEIHLNDFLSPSFVVNCESFTGSSCIRMERNWWNTTDEGAIRSHIRAGCPVCIDGWLGGPVGGLAAARAPR